MGTILEVQGVWKSFDDHQILRDVNMSVEQGGVVGLVGPGGVGKSILLKTLCGLIRPDRGTVRVFGQDIFSLTPPALAELRLKYGVLFQNYALFDFMTVVENVAFPLIQDGTDEEQAHQRASSMLAQLGLGGTERLFPNELSGGMKKRVSLARATITHPPLLLCDDPSAGLDPVTSSKIFKLLKSIQREHGSTCVVISHDIDRMVSICECYVMLFEGSVVFSGTLEEARRTAHPAVTTFFKGKQL